MEFTGDPIVGTKKNKIPILYLDTCIMLELAKYAKGICDNSHKAEIGELFSLLTQLMQSGKLLCPSGNQLQEMGMSHGKKDAKMFLLSFTNAWLKLPDEIKEDQLAIGYQAFIAQNPWIGLREDMIFDEDSTPDSQFRVHLAPIYKPETLEKRRTTKLDTVRTLNAMKQGGRIEKDWNAQLRSELLSDYHQVYWAFVRQEDYTPTIEHVLQQRDLLYSRTGLRKQAGACIPPEVADSYTRFLQSSYHHNLPFQRIEAVLWAHFMQRSNKIVRGDRLDALWASAYLPFVDYVITDHAFSMLLIESSIAETYNTEVYSMRNFRTMIDSLYTLAAT